MRAQAKSVFSLQAGFDEVTDVQWSPDSATALVVVKSRGVVEVGHTSSQVAWCTPQRTIKRAKEGAWAPAGVP